MIGTNHFTWSAAMRRAQALRFLGVQAHTRKHWWGYSVELRGGEDAVNWWKQFWCMHEWYDSEGLLYGKKIGRCSKCSLVRDFSSPS